MDAAAPEPGQIEIVNRRRSDRRVTGAAGDLQARAMHNRVMAAPYDQQLLARFARDRAHATRWMIPAILMAALLITGGRLTFTGAAGLALALFAQAAPILVGRSFLQTGRRAGRLSDWRGRFILSEAVASIPVSAVFAGLAWTAGGPPSLIGVGFMALLAIVALPTASFSRVLMAATLPVFSAAALMIAVAAGWTDAPLVDSLAHGALLGVGALFLHFLGWRIDGFNRAEVLARSEKDELIADLEHANAASDESRRKAEEANLAKSRFLAAMSHELRTPLNAILGFSEVMQTEMFGPVGHAAYKGYVTDIHDSGRHLLNLINEILDLSRIEAGRQTLSEESVSLAHLLEDCAHMIELRAAAKDLLLVEDIPDTLPRVYVDERAIRQVVLNLLSNAVKFTPTSGQIRLRAGMTADGGQFVSVRDSGPGIPAEEIPLVLSAFGQGSAAIRSAEQGTGLGLTIVQALVEMHGGKFSLVSNPGQGTEVFFTLPRARVLDQPANVDTLRRRRGAPLSAPEAAVLEAREREARSA